MSTALLQETVNPRICKFFVTHKNRYCKMLVSQGQRYCGQHLVNESSPHAKGYKRIPCPLDPKHSCFEHKLKQHMKSCNAKERPDNPYSSKGINEGDICREPEYQIHLQDLTDGELLAFISKVERTHKDFVGDIASEVKTHKFLEDILARPSGSTVVSRHMKQNASILGHLQQMNLLNDDTVSYTFIEFGAGKGQITDKLVEAVKNKENTVFILVDKGSQRYKCDSKLQYVEDVNIKRIRMDIKHLDLGKLDILKPDSSIVACGKHLCGSATDFTLRCLYQPVKSKIAGLIIALCCHHRCTWQAYTGKEFLTNAGYSPKDFAILISLSSWAVSGTRFPEEECRQDDKVEDKDVGSTVDRNTEAVKKESRYVELGLTVRGREEIGRKAKQILDMGRVEFLKKNSLEAKLVQYITKADTLENIALIAVPIVCNQSDIQAKSLI